MPFKKYQSLADSLAQNKRLSERRRGLRWTPLGYFFWRLHSTRTLGLHTRAWHAACLRARAVASCPICCLPKETTIALHIRTMPMWSGDRLRDFASELAISQYCEYTGIECPGPASPSTGRKTDHARSSSGSTNYRRKCRTSATSGWSACARWATNCVDPKRTSCATASTNCAPAWEEFTTGSYTSFTVQWRTWSLSVSPLRADAVSGLSRAGAPT